MKNQAITFNFVSTCAKNEMYENLI